MKCPSCRVGELPTLHVPGRDPYGRPLCDACFPLQLHASDLVRRLVETLDTTAHRARVTMGLVRSETAAILAFRSRRQQ